MTVDGRNKCVGFDVGFPLPSSEFSLQSDLQYYVASKIRGLVAKTLGFLKFRAQGLKIFTGPYFFCEIVLRGCSSRKFWSKIVKIKQLQVPHEQERPTGHHVDVL